MEIDEYINNLKQNKNTEYFNTFLELNIASTIKQELVNDMCICSHTVDNRFIVWYNTENKVIKKEFAIRNRRKLFYLLNNYKYIISDFSLVMTGSNNIILRKEVIDNYFFCDFRYYLRPDICYAEDDIEIYLTKCFFDELTKDRIKLEQIIFNSTLLNNFENGFTVDSINIKPTINISKYGRWYWSNTDKFQTNIAERNKIYNKLSKYGNVINIDLVSGEPLILSILCNSEILKKFILYRVSLKNKDEELRAIMKKFINIFIHSYPTLNSVLQTCINTIPNYKKMEDSIGVSTEKIIQRLFKDFEKYNKEIVTEYRENLECTELMRRIINPYAPIMSDSQIIKEHRKYMQGHTHDLVLKYAKLIFDDIPILPIFTIHDCICYFIDDNSIVEDFINIIKKNAKILKIPINFEIRRYKGDIF